MMPPILPLCRRFLAGAFLMPLLTTAFPAHAAPSGAAQAVQSWTNSGTEAALHGVPLAAPGSLSFRYADGPKGFFNTGFRVENDSSLDWSKYYGVRFEVNLPAGRELELTTAFAAAAHGGGLGEQTRNISRITGGGWHTLTLPWTAFDFVQRRSSFLHFIKDLTFSASFADQKPGQITLRNIRLIKAPVVALESAVRGKAAPAGGVAEYAVNVTNCTGQPQSVVLSTILRGWEIMESTTEPAALTLSPGESKPITFRVKVSDRVPPGGHEEQTLQAIANGDAASASQLSFITTSEVPHPYLLHTPERWQEVRAKVETYDWAREALAEYVKTADAWNVPEVTPSPKNDPGDNHGTFLFPTSNEIGMMASAYSWQIGGNRQHAAKVAEFLRRLSNPETGYPKTLRACSQGLVQEGSFFQELGIAYDMILDSGVLSAADRQQIEATFRLFIQLIDRENRSAAINNWNLAEVTGGFYCALAMQDLVSAERFFSGPGGIKDQLRIGTLDDGWWFECSISYNVWCASEFTQAALAYQPFGVNFKDMWLPASYSPKVMLASELSGGMKPKTENEEERRKPFGMDPDVYGPVKRPYRTITDLWSSLVPFLDYRSVMFGVNDSAENKVSGGPTKGIIGNQFELAYYVFRDPAYAEIIKKGGNKRDLIYGVPELPDAPTRHLYRSACADNVGLAMLRSQTENRPEREQIQAVLHYGTHGWAHGHYDRTDFISMMRYGRSFWNPESVFYIYEPYVYKFYTQTSLNHNMVVVDHKMQEATPGERTLFHSGKAMQATVVETKARWSNPPYGGMVYDYVPVKNFAEKMWREGRSIPIPENPPAYGTLTDYSEPILQRRAMVVTDDYIVLADYLKGNQPHTFENLLQIKGFKGIEAPQKKFERHTAQWDTNPLRGAQLVTDCDWYSLQAPAISRFEQVFGPGEDNEGTRTNFNEDGVLKMDVHTLWPKTQEVMVAAAPEFHQVQKRLFYTVRGDGKVLAEGKTGAWILGQAEVDVPLEGVKQLELETKTELSKMPTLFWGNARIVTADGKEIALADLPVNTVNIAQPKAKGQDYQGGQVKIGGIEYKESTPAEPRDAKQPGIARIDLAGLNAVRFKAVLGSDFPPGPEAARRKILAVRSQGSEARYITVIEPYETKALIRSAEALGPDKVRVELTDGRVQEITIKNFDGLARDISIDLNEIRNGTVVRTETASGLK